MLNFTWVLLATVLVAVVVITWRWLRRRSPGPAKSASNEARDTVADWPPTATRVLSSAERQAYDILRRALPGRMIFARIPLARFLRVPTRYSYGEWLGRAGYLCVDLLVCGGASEVIAAVEIRPSQESERSRQRHRRKARVLKAAGIRVLVWAEGDLPTVQAVREALLPSEVAAERAAARAPVPGAGPLTSIPVAEVREGEAGDLADERWQEPPSTTWYSDLDQPTHKKP